MKLNKMPSYLNRKNKLSLAYHYFEGQSDLPPVVFLGGFRSDMEGTKALYLEKTCKERDQSFLRFDYSGHGQSYGQFEEGFIGQWTGDAHDIITDKISRPAILVGSSMGGWISLLLALNHPSLFYGLIGLAAAPDFTRWIEEGMNAKQKNDLNKNGLFLLENDYGDPYAISKKLLDDGRKQSILNKNITVNFPVILIQGKKDADVPWQTAEKIKEVFGGKNIEVIYINEGDHRLSSPDELEIINGAILKMNGR